MQRIGGRDAKGGGRQEEGGRRREAGGWRQEEGKGEIRIENEPRETMVYAR